MLQDAILNAIQDRAKAVQSYKIEFLWFHSHQKKRRCIMVSTNHVYEHFKPYGK